MKSFLSPRALGAWALLFACAPAGFAADAPAPLGPQNAPVTAAPAGLSAGGSSAPADAMPATAAPATTLSTPASVPMIYDVRAYGATGDGQTLDTDAVNRAIEAAAAAGGGTVRFPAGNYLCYSIRLKSNIALYLDQGATIIAAGKPQEVPGQRGGGFGRGGPQLTVPDGEPGYDAPEPNTWGDDYAYQDYGHSHWHNSLIWGENLENISILGPGKIFGRGLTRAEVHTPGIGNKAIALKLCRNVILRDFTIQQGGWFGLLATGVDNFTISNIKEDTNRDGFDIDCCRNVHISDCTINSPNDDGLCLKSSYGLGFARPTENVSITNCQVSGYRLGTFLDGTYQTGAAVGVGGGGRGAAPVAGAVGAGPGTPVLAGAPLRGGGGGATGRIKFGTESNGGFRNITISNCVFIHCLGLALETVDGGVIEDVTINNISMQDILNAPIYIRLGHRMRGPDNTPVGIIRRVKISNIVASGVSGTAGILVIGTIDHPIEDVQLSDIRILFNGGGTKEQADIIPPEDEAQFYPEPGRLGTMPSYGLFARHVVGLTLRNVELSYANTDFRPPVILDDVNGVLFDHLKAQREDSIAAFMAWNTQDFTTQQCPGVPDTHFDKLDNQSVPAAAPAPTAAPAATPAPAAAATTPASTAPNA